MNKTVQKTSSKEFFVLVTNTGKYLLKGDVGWPVDEVLDASHYSRIQDAKRIKTLAEEHINSKGYAGQPGYQAQLAIQHGIHTISIAKVVMRVYDETIL